MPIDVAIPATIPIAFALVLTRVVGVFSFIPLPVKDAGPPLARSLFAVACTLALYSRWPVIGAGEVSGGAMAVWMFGEASFGVAVGLMVGFLSEAMVMGAQLLGLQAGYGYASVVDPTTQADSDVLQVFARLLTGLLFFATGLEGQVMRAFALSIDRYPPGHFVLTRSMAQMVIELGANVFIVGLRLAFPILGLLLMAEIALALVGRMSSQLQLGSSAAPLKMLLTLATLAAVLKIAPQLYTSYAEQIFRAVRHGLLG
jgi:flagellar biosynthetic protein FliR